LNKKESLSKKAPKKLAKEDVVSKIDETNEVNAVNEVPVEKPIKKVSAKPVSKKTGKKKNFC